MISTKWGTTEEVKRRNRIRLSLAAFSYELLDKSIMTDEEFDSLSKKIRKNQRTGHPRLDAFFRNHFSVDTGMWIYRHPELDLLEQLYNRLYGEKDD